MATDNPATGLPARAGFATRLREAWRVLRGGARRDESGAIMASRAADHPAARLIESLIAGLPGPAIVLDRDGRVIAFNQAALGLAPAMRRGDPALISLRMPELVNAIRRASKRREPQRVEFFERVPRDRWYEAFVRPVRLAGGEGGPSDLLLMTFNDLTPLRRVEEMRADFVANASHELRTPLASVLGFIETLRGPAADDPPAQQRFLAIMAEQASRMNRLIDDLLSLSRVELTEHEAPAGPVDLPALIHRVVAGFEPRLQAARATLELALAPDLAPVAGDADQLVQVAQNLLDNALKYGAMQATPAALTLTVAPADGARWPARPGVLLSVADRGPGIPRAHLPRLTERFYRVDAGRSRAAGGTGLGLAIVKHIVNRHRGQLAIDSTEGEGTTVTVWLPALPPAA